MDIIWISYGYHMDIMLGKYEAFFDCASGISSLGLALEPGVFQELHQTMRKFPGAAAIIKAAPGGDVLRRRQKMGRFHQEQLMDDIWVCLKIGIIL